MEVIKQIQIIDPEKLKELCCMHLSFTLDLHSEELASLLYSKNEPKTKKNYFSRKLKDKFGNETIQLTQDSISQIYQIIEYLGRDINVEHEGLFRKTGSLSRQQELKALLSAGATIDFTLGHYSIDDCASVIKNYLSELPEPLLTDAHYSAHCQIADMLKEDMSPGHKQLVFQRQLKAVRLLLLLLPQENYCLLKYLLLLLSQVKIAHEKNLMTAHNLATVFSPQIVCPRKMPAEQLKEQFPCMVKVLSFLIENATLIFEPPSELLKDVSLYLKDLQFHRGSDEPNMQNENKTDDCEDTRRKHFRSRSVGDAIKRHLWKTSSKSKDSFHKGYHHSSYDMLSTRPTACTSEETAPKAKSVEALNLEKAALGNKNGLMMKNWLRASRKIKEWQN